MGRLVIPAGDVLLVESEPEEEAFVFVSDGELEGHPAGSVLRIRGVYQVAAVTETTLVGALVRASDAQPHTPAPLGVSAVRLEESPVLLNAGGKLRVQILHDAASGASFGALSLLDADADLSVPEHVHETSVEALYILSGDGAMILGEERTLVVPGRVIYVPANTNHGYEAWTEPLRALQIYAPPGPEQRFRGLVPSTEDVAVDGT
jgi:mannose-6-phosphate isomerase-like protein (cupin superfamily)